MGYWKWMFGAFCTILKGIVIIKYLLSIYFIGIVFVLILATYWHHCFILLAIPLAVIALTYQIYRGESNVKEEMR